MFVRPGNFENSTMNYKCESIKKTKMKQWFNKHYIVNEKKLIDWDQVFKCCF